MRRREDENAGHETANNALPAGLWTEQSEHSPMGMAGCVVLFHFHNRTVRPDIIKFFFYLSN